jgi:hypothetical protein
LRIEQEEEALTPKLGTAFNLKEDSKIENSPTTGSEQ